MYLIIINTVVMSLIYLSCPWGLLVSPAEMWDDAARRCGWMLIALDAAGLAPVAATAAAADSFAGATNRRTVSSIS